MNHIGKTKNSWLTEFVIWNTFITLKMSSIEMLKSNGPKIEHCGMPASIFSHLLLFDIA